MPTALDIHTVTAELPALDALLRRRRLVRGPDVWQSVHDLLIILSAQGRFPQTPEVLARYLGPLLCRNQDEQAEFPKLFDEWLTGQPQNLGASLASPPSEQGSMVRLEVARERSDRRGKWVLLAAVGLALAALFFVLLRPYLWQDKTVTAEVTYPKPSPPPQVPLQHRSKLPPKPKAELDPWVPPNRNPAPYRPDPWRQQTLQQIQTVLPWLPCLFALPWLAWQYRRHWIAERNRVDGEALLDQFNLSSRTPLFGGETSGRVYNQLGSSRWTPTRRLDIDASVESTARRAGYFHPQHRQRRTSPSYLVLVNSARPDDQRAAMAEELVRRFREAKLAVDSYRFADDPRWLFPWGGEEFHSRSLRELASRHPDAHLLVISDTAVLFHPVFGTVRDWADSFHPWLKRFWLNPDEPDAYAQRVLSERNFCVLPLTETALGKLCQWLRYADGLAPEFELDGAEALPAIVADDPEHWLRPYLAPGLDLTELLQSLGSFLKTDGMRLLRALAAYPEPRWNLTLAMDYQLFGDAPDLVQTQEQRLSRLSRLPWMRHAYMPDYLREALLLQEDTAGRQSIGKAWAGLFGGLTDQSAPGALTLPLAAPPKRSLRQRLLDLRLGRNPPPALDDPIFINILLGGRLGLLDFRLPRSIARHLPASRWFLNLQPLLLALLSAGLAAWLLVWAWQTGGILWLGQFWDWEQKQANAAYQVKLFYGPGQQQLADVLTGRLTGQGYRVEPPSADGKADADTRNSLAYPTESGSTVLRIGDLLAQATYGLQPELRANPTPGETKNVNPKPQQSVSVLNVRLNQSYQAGASFNDSLANRLDAPAKHGDVFLDAFQNKDATAPLQYGPVMLALAGGSFIMGCQEAQDKCNKDELPAHPVTVKPFALGRYEVSFAEYDAYVASLQGKTTTPAQGCEAVTVEMPKDQGWGRGPRPVINVNWDQARCYAAWLSDRTGHAYRLPSEAEFEYALRGGMNSAYPWGDKLDESTLYAWNWDNSSKQTHPAGLKRPNGFGLYDLSGNAWEWVADCYHDNYQGAPSDGSVWEGKPGCSRGVRGGSWNNGPQFLRSANRVRNSPYVAGNYFLGFRLARAL